MKKYILLIATILLMALIFFFSAQPADESTEVSNSVGAFIGRIFVSGFEELPPEEQLAYVQSIDHTVRKSAHAAEYLLLGFLSAWTLMAWFGSRRYFVPAGWLIAVLYCVTDEIHQIFTPGRACRFTDICIDAAGAACGCLLLYLLFRRRFRISKDPDAPASNPGNRTQ